MSTPHHQGQPAGSMVGIRHADLGEARLQLCPQLVGPAAIAGLSRS
jgi:hypothetical protein